MAARVKYHFDETKRQDIILVYKYFQRENQKQRVGRRLTEGNLFEKTAQALKVSRTAVKRIVVNSTVENTGTVSRTRKKK